MIGYEQFVNAIAVELTRHSSLAAVSVHSSTWEQIVVQARAAGSIRPRHLYSVPNEIPPGAAGFVYDIEVYVDDTVPVDGYRLKVPLR